MPNKHLFLLIGKNPLPNYVAAKLLIERGTNVYFVYSEKRKESAGTERYKKCLVDKLKSQLGGDFFAPIDVPLVNPSDATCIKSAIENQFGNIPNNATINLNYTGGTKAMSVHTYRAIEEFSKKKNCELKFSYLDSRELKLRFDGESGGFELGRPDKEKALFDTSKINLLDLLFLHALKPLQRKSPNPRQEVRFEKVMHALLEERYRTSEWNKVGSIIGTFLSHGVKESFREFNNEVQL